MTSKDLPIDTEQGGLAHSATLTAQGHQADNSVAMLKLSSLRPQQRKLYELIVGKIDTGDMVTLKEASEIWLSRVCRHKAKDGSPLRWDYYANRYERDGQTYYTGELVRMTQDEITFNVLNWLTKNIGLLVIRGYLKVIPMIEVQSQETLTDLASPDKDMK